jgi:hypothetical protein
MRAASDRPPRERLGDSLPLPRFQETQGGMDAGFPRYPFPGAEDSKSRASLALCEIRVR